MAAIYFHPNNCSSSDGVVTLAAPGSVGVGWCAFNDDAFPGRPAGGFEVRRLQLPRFRTCRPRFAMILGVSRELT